MSTYEGCLLRLGTVDKCGRKFAEDCKITFPDKVPVTYNFQIGVGNVLGTADISRDEAGLKCKVTMTHDDFNGSEYFVGGYYYSVQKHKEGDITVIDSCRLVGMSIVPDAVHCSDENKIWKVED